jgi:hypothetical protein
MVSSAAGKLAIYVHHDYNLLFRLETPRHKNTLRPGETPFYR